MEELLGCPVLALQCKFDKNIGELVPDEKDQAFIRLTCPPNSLKHKANRKTYGNKVQTSGDLNFKEFSKAVYSLFGSYLRLMSMEEVENEVRNIIHALIVDVRARKFKFNVDLLD